MRRKRSTYRQGDELSRLAPPPPGSVEWVIGWDEPGPPLVRVTRRAWAQTAHEAYRLATPPIPVHFSACRVRLVPKELPSNGRA